MYRKVLLLNINYTPIGIVSWKKAIGLVIGRNKAHVVEEYVDRRSLAFNGAVIRLNVKTPNPYGLFKSLNYSKNNIFLRDKFCCVYCGKKLTRAEITVDHVIPKSQGGPSNYLNCVSSCKPCNAYKDNKTPEQAGMRIMVPVKKPDLKDLLFLSDMPFEWVSYLNCSTG